MRGVNGQPDYYLICPETKAAYFEEICYGSRGEEEPDATCEYDGAKNTIALVESEHNHPAADQIAALTIEGHSDFYFCQPVESYHCCMPMCQSYLKRHGTGAAPSPLPTLPGPRTSAAASSATTAGTVRLARRPQKIYQLSNLTI